MKKNYSDRGEFFYSLKKTLLIMRIAIVLLLVGFLQTQANDAYAQKAKLSVSFTNTQLAKVLDKIENESEFFFLYNEKLIDANRKVSIDAKDELIDEVLKTIFAGTDVEYTISDRKIILAPAYLSESQQPVKKITGKVTDQSGASLPGVTVMVKGTTNGSITDANGKYSLSNIPENGTLKFSFVGMKTQEIAIGNKTSINVSLADESIGLDEVVAIGSGSRVTQIHFVLMLERPRVRVTRATKATIPTTTTAPTTRYTPRPNHHCIRHHVTGNCNQSPPPNSSRDPTTSTYLPTSPCRSKTSK